MMGWNSPGGRAARIALTLVFLLGSPSGAPWGTPEPRSGYAGTGISGIANAQTSDWSAPHVAGELLIALSDPEAHAVQARLAAAGMPVIEVIPQLDIAVVRVEEAEAGPMGLPIGPGEPEALALAAARAETLALERTELPIRSASHPE
jgi:hypothetical protein